MRVIRDYAHKNGLAERLAPVSHLVRRRPVQTSNTFHETKRLFEQRMSIAEIADFRGLSKGTIAGHIESLIDAGEMLDLSHILPPAERVSAIEAAFKSTGSSLLSPVRELLGNGYSYEELRLVRVHLRQSDDERLIATQGS